MTPQGGMVMGNNPPPVNVAQPSGGTIPLALLIEYGLQRTHHELMVLSELLPRKTDMDRKIEIFQFASRTRQLFVRLLALVKWANSASKVDKCMDICNFLEQQSMYFVETADSLHKMAKETLASARLPNFSLPCAIDVLTTGTYPRLPTCIRDRIIPSDPITPAEKQQTLQRLNEVIQYRLVSNELPKQMRRLKIDQGRVKFFVEHEFEVTLTLMGDSPTIPWRLLDVSFLVEDNETGHGKSLVHSMQVHYIHELAQSRLLQVDHPLHDLYKVLHSFCQSLQLEVLHSQTQRLMRDRLGDSIHIEEYTLSKSLTISYWRDQLKKEKNLENFQIHKLSVHVCEEDEGKPLQISHQPPMSAAENRKVGLAIKSDHLSIEKLLMQTIEVRTHSKLKELAREIQRMIDGKCEVCDIPVALHVSVLNPCMSSEVLRISIDVQTGSYMASVPSCTHPAVQSIEDSLNGEHRNMEKLLMKLKVQLVLQRCEKCVQLMMTNCRSSLPIINLADHPLTKLAQTRLYVRVPKQQGYFLVLEVREGERRQVQVNYYMLETTLCTADGQEDDLVEDNIVKAFMKAGRMTPIDVYSLTHGEFTKVFDGIPLTIDSLTRKRKIFLGEEPDKPEAKQTKGSPYFVSELAYLLARCEEKMPYIFLGEELSKQNISHDGGVLDSSGTCLALGILFFPEILGLPEEVNDGLRNQLLQCKFRIQSRSRLWVVEFLFMKSPLPSIHIKETGPSQRTCMTFEITGDNVRKTVTDVLDEWAAMAYLFGAVQRFAESYNDVRTGLSSMVEIQSYNYRKLTMAYGPNMCSLVSIKWNPHSKRFELTLGTRLPSSSSNPHIPMLLALTEEFNLHRSLSQLSQTLHETWTPMMSIQKLPAVAVMGANQSNRQHLQSFAVIPQSSSHVRIVFRGCHCLDVHFRPNKQVAVRDGAYSLFDTTKVMDGLLHTGGLKNFLTMFLDESVSMGPGRQASAVTDEESPSPLSLDPSEMFMSQPPSTGSPAQRATQQRQDSFRFHSPMTPPSNPHTPASPGSARLPTGVNPSPSATLMGTPSPGALLTANSPSNPPLHVPSPGAFVPAPSPQSLVGLHMQSPAASFISPGMVDAGSPFPGSSLAMPSPGARGGWVGSPSVQDPSPISHHTQQSPGHPALHSPQTHKDGDLSKMVSVVSPQTRIIPQRTWGAAAAPIILSHKGFHTLLTPTPVPIHQQGSQPPVINSPLERFFACIIMKKQVVRIINQDPAITQVTSEPGVMCFKVDNSLQFKISINSSTSQSLHTKISPTPDAQDKWSAEELQILEKFFDVRVFCPPYKLNTIHSALRIVSAPLRIVKDCIQIMKMELMPDRSMKWTVHWCLTIPPSLHSISPVGVPAFIVKAKMIFIIQLTRIGLSVGSGEQSIVIPLVYEMQTNKLTRVDRVNSPAMQAVGTMLNRFAEHYQQQNHNNECAILPAVKELMTNLVLPM